MDPVRDDIVEQNFYVNQTVYMLSDRATYDMLESGDALEPYRWAARATIIEEAAQ